MPHTPGKWKFCKPEGSNGFYWVDSEDSGGGSVATVWGTEDGKDAREDAALIASAPELLEALKSWVAMENSSNVSKDRFDAVMKAATEAIAKAEGK